MATLDVTAPRAEFNGACATPFPAAFPRETASRPQAAAIDRFSRLIAAVMMAQLAERRREAGAHDAQLRRLAEAAWTGVRTAAARCRRPAPVTREEEAFVAFARVLDRLAETRGTPAGRRLLADLLTDPEALLALFHRGASERSRALMAVAFNQIDRLSALGLFAPQGGELRIDPEPEMNPEPEMDPAPELEAPAF
jgi:hypothetical protein